MDLSFTNKIALVTGAGAGIGLTIARAPSLKLARRWLLADHQEWPVQFAVKELVASGRKALEIHCDVADEDQVAAMVEQTVATFGRLDAAFNNAGVQSPAVETADSTSEELSA